MIPAVKLHRVVGAVISAAAGVALAWAITSLSRTGSCGNVGQAACPASAGQAGLVVAGSLILLAIGAVLTWGVGVLLAALSGGVTALVLAAAGPAHSRLPAVIVGTAFLAAFVLPGLVALGALRASRRRQAHVAEFRKRAIRAAGVVTAVADTAFTVNDNPQVRLTIRYSRADGTVAETEVKQMVSRLRIPQAGAPATVWYDPGSEGIMAELDESQPADSAVEAPSALPTRLVSELERLAALHSAGTLTDEEFARAKQQLLGAS
jgi:hypothetical protein